MVAIILGPARPPSDDEEFRRVYAALPGRSDYDRLGQWCRLPQAAATAAEADAIRSVIRAAPDPDRVWLGPAVERWKKLLPPDHWARVANGEVRPPKRVEYVRVSHPTDSNQWIGIGVCAEYNTAEWSRWVVCRAAVGFRPGPDA